MAHFLRQIAVFALFTCWAGVWAQQATAPKWGKIEPAQFGPDLAGRFPDAAAVVLHDYGELSFGMGTEGYLVILDRHVRIRILTEAGGSLAVQSIPYISGLPGENEVVRRVRAQTLYEQGGKVIAVPVPGSDIRTEQAEPGWMEIRISFPEIKPGAILEYTYRMVSPNYYRPPEWPFQREIPTLISEVKMRPNKLLDYAILLRGGSGEQLELRSEHHWRMENTPPIREEPFTTTLNDNWRRLHFRLRGERGMIGYHPAVFTWNEFSTKLLQDPDLGGRLDSVYPELRETARELAGLFDESEKKIDILYQAVRDRMSWNGESDLFAPRKLSEVWETKQGNSAEIHLLLAYLLRAAGIRADPMLISTRDHGAPIRTYPDLASFNHLICYVEGDEEGLFLDATDPLRPYSLADSRDLNHWGWLLSRELPRWVAISPRSFVAMQQVYGSMRLDSTGRVVGEIRETTSGYTALAYRRVLKSSGETAFVNQYLAGYLNAGELLDYSISSADLPEQPLAIEWNIRSGDYATISGDRLLLRPMLMFAMTQNPLPAMTRYQPIDLGHPYQSSLVFSFELPPDYEVESLPERLSVTFPQREAIIDFRCQVVAGILNVESSMMIQATLFPPEAYDLLRGMYRDLIDKHAENIVLRRR